MTPATRQTRAAGVLSVAALFMTGCAADPVGDVTALDAVPTASAAAVDEPTDDAERAVAGVADAEGVDPPMDMDPTMDPAMDMDAPLDASTDPPMDPSMDPSMDMDVATVAIEMSDFAFSPATVTLTAGEPTMLVFTNTGTVAHEVVIGDMHVQDEHEEAMAGGGHGTHMADTLSTTVEPGGTGRLLYPGDAADDLLIGCHIPGHWDAGMRGTLTVE